MSEAIALRYIGNGAFLPGVPARDLTNDEAVKAADLLWSRLSLEQIQANKKADVNSGEDLLLNSGLYTKPSAPAKTKSGKE